MTMAAEHDAGVDTEKIDISVSDLPATDRDADHRAPAWLPAQYRFLRHWLARGRQGSAYWVPRIGDRVRLHGRGAWLVYAVRIRRGEVQLGDPGIRALTDVEPATREDLDALYGTPNWDRVSGRRDWVLTPQVPESDDEGEEEAEPPQLRAVPNLDDMAGDGQEVETQ
jgi:hypothetical protein